MLVTKRQAHSVGTDEEALFTTTLGYIDRHGPSPDTFAATGRSEKGLEERLAPWENIAPPERSAQERGRSTCPPAQASMRERAATSTR